MNSSLPFTGGWFAYLSYELIGQIELTLTDKLHKSKLPIAYAVEIPSAIIIDHKLDKTFIIDQDSNHSRIDLILSDIKLLGTMPTQRIKGDQSEEVEKKFIDGVKDSLDYIVAGDVFQVNLSRKWQYELEKKN